MTERTIEDEDWADDRDEKPVIIVADPGCIACGGEGGQVAADIGWENCPFCFPDTEEY